MKKSKSDMVRDVRMYQRVMLEVLIVDTIVSKPLVLDWYMPCGVSRAPVIIILPILGGEEYRLERYFARYFTKYGFAALIVNREKEQLIADEREVNTILRQSMSDVRFVVDWIGQQGELAADRVAILGISMGAITGTLLTAVDCRIKAAVLALAGGDIPYILRHSQDGAWRGKGITKKRAEYLKQKRITPFEFEQQLRSKITCEPLEVAEQIDPEKILLILALCDRVIPFKKGLQLRRAMRNPRTIILMSGHYGAMAYLPYLRRMTFRFFKEKLDVLTGVTF